MSSENVNYSKKYNTPPFMWNKASSSFLTHNPIYKEIFHKCPSCNALSLKPDMPYSSYSPLSVKACKQRRCTLCGYIHNSEQLGGHLDEYTF